MKTVPRRAMQTVTLYLVVCGANLWWYLDTNAIAFLLILAGMGVGGVFAFRNDITAVRTGRKDAQGITTLIGDLKTRREKFCLGVFGSALATLSAFLMLRERTFIPSEVFEVDADPVVWFMFSAFTLAFATWVRSLKEKVFWFLVMVVAGCHGSMALLLSIYSESPSFRNLAIIFWFSSVAAELALLLFALWLLHTSQVRRAERN